MYVRAALVSPLSVVLHALSYTRLASHADAGLQLVLAGHSPSLIVQVATPCVVRYAARQHAQRPRHTCTPARVQRFIQTSRQPYS